MLPVVDMGAFLSALEQPGEGRGGEEEEEGGRRGQRCGAAQSTAKSLHQAILEHGRCHLANHGIPHTVVQQMMLSSKQFFELEVKVKDKYRRGDSTNHGWACLEREKLSEKRPHGDLKESFNYSPCEEETPMPTEVPEMSAAFHAMFQACQRLSLHLLDLMGSALGLQDPSVLTQAHQLCGQKGSYTTLRSLYYPLSSQVKEGQIACGEHSDYGSITLLIQDDTGGLQIQGKDGQYHDVSPVSGAVLVMVGDLMQRWTNDQYPATKHRVIVPPGVGGGRAGRQTLAFFCQPDHHALITCLDGSNTYPPVTSAQYLASRFSATY